ncbi:unnamed protein product [Rotaria sordida]|uniref:Ubiquitin-specific peptidase-like SUMO isopeptidase domain-containing protein n=1 Tax=Rotaria sordida TaxID=392033 RepID=A0A814U5H9_9BILA|nr:unnamed protein product [Rotaria sordida]
MTSENIWSRLISTRQLSSNYYIISTCLTDILYRCSSRNLSIFHNLSQTLFSSSIDQIKLLNDYTNILQNILKQNSLHTNIIQNIRRLFRFDLCLKELFSTILDEHCQCHECDCTISNSIDDVIHDVDEIQLKLLIESSQLSCICFRCNDKNQLKTLTFKQFSPCLALTVNRLHINIKDQLINTQGIIYDLIYIIEFDQTLHSILNVYQRQDIEFVIVDGIDISNRRSTIDSQGKFLTLWMSQEINSPNNEIHIPLSQLISSSPATTLSEGTSDNDILTDIYLTLLHSTNKNHTINSLTSNTLSSIDNNQIKQHNEETLSSSTIKSKRTHHDTTA